MADIITAIIVAIIIGAAIYTIYKNKKIGKCVGCSCSATCSNRECCTKEKGSKEK